MTLVADGQAWTALEEWEEDTVPDRRFPPLEEAVDELAALFVREAA